MLVRRAGWNEKPPVGPVEIDWGHTLARSLAFYLPLNEAGVFTARDLVRGVGFNEVCSDGGPPVFKDGALVVDYHQGLLKTDALLNLGGSDWTVAWNVARIQNWDCAVVYQASYGGLQISLRANVTPWKVYCERIAVATLCDIDGPSDLAFGQYNTFGLSRIYNTSCTAYCRGVSLGTTATAGTFDTTGTQTQLCYQDGHYRWIGAWRRVLSAGEHAQLNAEPWAFLKPVIRRAYSKRPAAATRFGGVRLTTRPNDAKPPLGQARINWSHPLAKGLVHLWLFNESGGDRSADLVNPTGANDAIKYDAAANVWTRDGYTLGYAGNLTAAVSAASNLGSGFTVLARRTLLGTYNSGIVCRNTYTGFIFNYSTSPDLRIVSNSNSTDVVAPWTNDGRVHDFVASVELGASGGKIYVDGVPLAKTTDGTIAAYATGATPWMIGSQSGFNDGQGTQVVVGIWSRVLTPAEIRLLYEQPYCLLESSPRRTYVFRSTAGSGIIYRMVGVLTGVKSSGGGMTVSGGMTPSGSLARQLGKALAGDLSSISGSLVRRLGRAFTAGVTPSGALAKGSAKAVAGGMTPSGALTKAPSKGLAGALAPTGALSKRLAPTFAGGMTPSGALGQVKTKLLSLAGGLTPTGAWVGRVGKSLVGALAPAGALAKASAKALAGGMTPAGALASVKTKLQSLAGALAPTGLLGVKTAKPVSGGLTPTGTVSKTSPRTLAGGVTPTGALAQVKTKLLSVAGTLTMAGALTLRTAKTLAGAITPGGALDKRLPRTLAGGMTPAGALTQVKSKLQSLSGTVSMAGTLVKRIGVTVAGVLTSSGDLGTGAKMTLAGSVTPAGALSKGAAKIVAGSVTPAGSVKGAAGKALSGVLALAGALTKRASKTLAGGIAPSGALAKGQSRTFGGIIGSAGAVVGAWLGELPKFVRALFTSSSPTATFTSKAVSATFTSYEAAAETMGSGGGTATFTSRGPTATFHVIED
jgi:hypothetical protein